MDAVHKPFQIVPIRINQPVKVIAAKTRLVIARRLSISLPGV